MVSLNSITVLATLILKFVGFVGQCRSLSFFDTQICWFRWTVSNIRNDITGIKTNIEGIVSKANQNKTSLDETNKKVNESDGKFEKVQAQFDKIELSIKKLATGETTPKEMMESTNIGQSLKDIKDLSEAILLLKNDLGLLKQLVLSNYHLISGITTLFKLPP